MTKRFAIVAGVLTLVGVAYALYLVSALSLASDCSDEIKKEVSSADGAYVAAFFERNCGATTGSTSNVSLRGHGTPFEQGNSEPILVLDGVCEIDVAWTGRALAASYPESCSVAKQSASWRDVRITFQPLGEKRRP